MDMFVATDRRYTRCVLLRQSTCNGIAISRAAKHHTCGMGHLSVFFNIVDQPTGAGKKVMQVQPSSKLVCVR